MKPIKGKNVFKSDPIKSENIQIYPRGNNKHINIFILLAKAIQARDPIEPFFVRMGHISEQNSANFSEISAD